MGGLFHLFDFHYGYLGRKHKKQGTAAVDAPRNSLELTAETWQAQYNVKDEEQDLPKRSYYPTPDASMKKLICEEISRGSTNSQNAPSIVARLMGMDVLPADKKSEAQPQSISDKNDKTEIIDKEVQHVEKVSAVQSPVKTKSLRKKENRSYKDAYFRYLNSATNLGKPRPRIHPQEKELQKFKKEFEAWQAARFLECARVVEIGNIPDQWLAQLDLTKEKMALYETSRKTVVEKPVKSKSSRLRTRSLLSVDFDHREFKKDRLSASHRDSYSLSGFSSSRDFEQFSFKNADMSSEKSSAPTKIVILKPGPESFSTANDESWVTSNCSIEDRDCIEDLLEEVKERLKCEMQGKVFGQGSMVRGGGIETPYKEKPAYKKATYQPDVRGSGSRHLSRRLLRSESARSYRSEIFAGEVAPSSPEFVTGETRKLLSDRLRNVLDGENEKNQSDIISDDFRREHLFDDARARLEKARDILNAENGRDFWRDFGFEDAQARSFRCDFSDDESFQEQPSPSNLVRSLSAPVSGMSFGKLLLEDRNVPAGAQIKRKHEYLDGQRKERSNFREKVSNIKTSLSLRKKLFRRKLQSSVDTSETAEIDSPKSITDGPRILTGFNDRIENSTEVPPSPASVCSSVHEELWKPTDISSLKSVSEVTSVGDSCVGNVFREISSNLTELRKQLNELDYECSEVTTVAEDPSEPDAVQTDVVEPEADDHEEHEAQAYVKNLLVKSGLYDGSWVKSFSRWDPYVKPMSNWVFEKVQESYSKPANEDKEIDFKDRNLEHKLLFDLLNEALTVLLGPPRTLSKFRRNISDISMLPPPQGRKLLEQVWEMICEYLNPSVDPACYSLDDLVAHDLNITPWSNLIDEEMSALGKELEYQIARDLVEGLVLDLQF